jgi:hypothetical protein
MLPSVWREAAEMDHLFFFAIYEQIVKLVEQLDFPLCFSFVVISSLL